MNDALNVVLTVDPEIPVPPVYYGGIERIVDMLARGLSRRGHHVSLFAHPQSTSPVQRIGWPGRRSGSALDSLRNMAALATASALRRADIVHSFSRLSYLLPLLALPIPKLMSYQRGITASTTARAVALSRGTLEFTALSRQMLAGRTLAGRWHIVPNGVDLPSYHFTPSVPDDAPLVFLGRVEEIKGPHLAIDVARACRIPLVIAGNIPPEHQPWFDRMIRPAIDGQMVSYVGPVDDEAKNALLGRARALLMPILWEEPFGIVMAEAMACGTPVLGLARGAVPEVVASGETGFVTHDVAELVEAVGKLPGISRQACRVRAEKFFSADPVVEAYLAIYRAMIARRRGAAP